MNPRDIMPMLMSSMEMRRALPRLLNFNRANEMRSVLHPMEWKNSLNDLLLADAEDLLRKAPIKSRALKAVLQSLLDFFPELYLETIRLALDAAKYAEDHPDEHEDLTEAPFAVEDYLADSVQAGWKGDGEVASADAQAPTTNGHQPTVTEIVPAFPTELLPHPPATMPSTTKQSEQNRSHEAGYDGKARPTPGSRRRSLRTGDTSRASKDNITV